MKFVLDGLALTDGGGKELALNLIARLPQFTQHEFILILPDTPDYTALDRATNLSSQLFRKPRSLIKRHLFLNHRVPAICRQCRAEALLCLANFPPRRRAFPTVVFVQNAHLVYRDPVLSRGLTLRERMINAYGRSILSRTLPRCDVIVQTEIIKQRIVSQYQIAPHRVAVIPNGRGFAGADAAARAASRTGRDFTFLCLGRYYGHKNWEVVLDAAELLPAYSRLAFRCVLTISPEEHPGARKLLARIQSRNLRAAVTSIGLVPRDRLAAVLGSSDALLMPTLLESHTRTYSEAMQMGLPILTSDRDFAHHLCKDAALYFDPLDPVDVARSMARILEDAGLRARLVANGRRILREEPTWDDIAARFVAVLEAAATGRSISHGCLPLLPHSAQAPAHGTDAEVR